MIRKITIFGDSIAYGAVDLELGGWVNRLKLYLNINSIPNNVFNMGIPRETTNDVLKRFDNEMKTRAEIIYDETDPINDVIVFAIGINDTRTNKGKNEVSKQQFYKNIDSLIKKAKNFSDNIIFMGLTNIDEDKVATLPWNETIGYNNKDIKEYDKIIEELCKDNQLKYIKIFNILNKDDLADGLHPNAKGHKKIFKTIQPEVLKKIKV